MHTLARRVLDALAVLSLVAAAPTALYAHPADDDRVQDEVLMELVAGADATAVAERYTLTLLEGVARWRLWRARTAPGEDVDDLVKRLKDDPDIVFAEPHRKLETPEGVKRALADLDFTADTQAFRQQNASELIRAPQAHQHYTGRGITVAVLDTGTEALHPELAGRVRNDGRDFAGGDGTTAPQDNQVDDDADALVDESSNHGTFVAGLVNLAAPDAAILPVRVLEADGKGTAFGVTNGILYAMGRGADVINLSLSMAHDSKYVERAIEDAEDAGIIVVVAAGNRGLDVLDFPAYLPEVVAVAAVDPSRVRADFSNAGPEVAVSAPGEDLLSAHGADHYAHWSGTSFATPLVAGAVAAMLEKYPGLDAKTMRGLLRDSAQPDNNPPELDGLMGGGVLDMEALTATLTTDRTSTKALKTPDGVRWTWSPVLDATRYDLARGDLANILPVDGAGGETQIDLGPLVCIADDLLATDTTGFEDPAVPAPGQVFFYVLRDDAPDPGGGTYGTDGDDHPRIAGGGDCPDAP